MTTQYKDQFSIQTTPLLYLGLASKNDSLLRDQFRVSVTRAVFIAEIHCTVQKPIFSGVLLLCIISVTKTFTLR